MAWRVCVRMDLAGFAFIDDKNMIRQYLPSSSIGSAPLATLSPEGEGSRALLPPGEGWGEQSEGAEGGKV